MTSSEIEKIIERYNRRADKSNLYNYLLPSVYLSEWEKEKKIIKWINYSNLRPLNNKTLLEIGCGDGKNLLKFLQLGFEPQNLVGNELLENRIQIARKKLSDPIKIIPGNALEIDIKTGSFDVVYQSMVFSSILDLRFQDELAKKMWDWVKPGGGILWYDFIYNNPHNKDVAGIPISRIKQLFPKGSFKK